MRKAPWKDYDENDLYEGDIIAHPSGQKGKIVYHEDRPDIHDKWCVDYRAGYESRLCLQIGDKGMAIKFVPIKITPNKSLNLA